jgi:hypothetical protein
MEIGGFFLLVIVIVVVGGLGGLLYAIAARLRHKELDPEGNKLDTSPESGQRPEHAEVQSEQKVRFVDT